MNSKPLLLGEARQLFGMLTSESRPSSELGVIILNAGLLHHVGPHRLHVDLANRLAEIGIPVIRVDQSGKGESTKRVGMRRFDSVLVDYDDAFKELEALGVTNTLLIGLCSGADDAMIISPQRKTVTGMILLDGFAVRNLTFYCTYIKIRALRLRSWLHALERFYGRLTAANTIDDEKKLINIRDWSDTKTMLGYVATVMERGGHVLSIFSGGQDYYNYCGQLEDNLSQCRDLRRLTEMFYSESDHTYCVVKYREKLIAAIVEWVDRVRAIEQRSR